MHKVVIERPRWNPGPGKHGRRGNLPDELLPKFEGIKRPHHRRKGLTDLLGPLKRWLRSQVGRPWNDVYSEACAVIKPDSIIRAHVKTHLLEFVERNTFMNGNEVWCYPRGWGKACAVADVGNWSLFYVRPETGVLELSPRMSRKARRAREPKEPVTEYWIRKNVSRRQIRGLWFECHFVRPDYVKDGEYDHGLERVVKRDHITLYRSHYLLCVFKRQLSGRELREHGLRNDISQIDGAQSSACFYMSTLTTALWN